MEIKQPIIARQNATFEGNTTFERDATFEGDTAFERNTTFEGNTAFEGNTTFERDATFEGNTTFEKNLMLNNTRIDGVIYSNDGILSMNNIGIGDPFGTSEDGWHAKLQISPKNKDGDIFYMGHANDTQDETIVLTLGDMDSKFNSGLAIGGADNEGLFWKGKKIAPLYQHIITCKTSDSDSESGPGECLFNIILLSTEADSATNLTEAIKLLELSGYNNNIHPAPVVGGVGSRGVILGAYGFGFDEYSPTFNAVWYAHGSSALRYYDNPTFVGAGVTRIL